jgi:hypothetical protein
MLMLVNVHQANVGLYRVVIHNSTNQVVESEPAALELGPAPTIYSSDKLEDALQRGVFFWGRPRREGRPGRCW